MAWEQYKEIFPTAKKMVRKAKALAVLNLARGIKSNKKSFPGYIGNERKTRQNVAPFRRDIEDLVMQDTEKTDVFNDFLAQSSPASAPAKPETQKGRAEIGKMKNCPM